MSPSQFVIKSSTESLLQILVERTKRYVDALLKTHSYVTIAFSGGRTPKKFFQQLRFSSLPWKYIHIFLVDERWVPPTHEESNYRLLKENLLDYIPIPEENVHPMPVLHETPEKSAQKYEQEILSVFGLAARQIPEFDLIFLGMGADGHTASIFPGDVAKRVFQSSNLVMTLFVPQLDTYRMTLTLKVINNAKQVWFLVTGKEKAKTLQKIHCTNVDPLNYPAKAVNPTNQPPIWFLDSDAASLLKNCIKTNPYVAKK